MNSKCALFFMCIFLLASLFNQNTIIAFGNDVGEPRNFDNLMGFFESGMEHVTFFNWCANRNFSIPASPVCSDPAHECWNKLLATIYFQDTGRRLNYKLWLTDKEPKHFCPIVSSHQPHHHGSKQISAFKFKMVALLIFEIVALMFIFTISQAYDPKHWNEIENEVEPLNKELSFGSDDTEEEDNEDEQTSQKGYF